MASEEEQIANLRDQADMTTNESLESTRRMRQLAEESRQVGANTLTKLDEQGRQLDNVERDLDKINADMRQGEKHLSEMEKFCGLCVCPWNKPKNYESTKSYSKAYGGDKATSSQPRGNAMGVAQPSTSAVEGVRMKRVTNDAREDEMEENLDAVGGILGDLKSQAKDMNVELAKQNEQLDRVDIKTESNIGRVNDANHFDQMMEKVTFSIRILRVDNYLAAPIFGLDPLYETNSGSNYSKVPVIRVFGSTPASQKCCLHVHGYLPYMYVNFDQANSGKFKTMVEAEEFINDLCRKINNQLETCIPGGRTDRHTRFISHISVVRAVDFYGYYPDEKYFLKVYYLNPKHRRRLHTFLQYLNFVIYESHLDYEQKFLIDYNLFGMDFLHAGEKVFFRQPYTTPSRVSQELFTPATQNSGTLRIAMDRWTVPQMEERWLKNLPRKQSTCELESDIRCDSILNAIMAEVELGGPSGLTNATALTSPNLVKSLKQMWDEEARCRREECLPPLGRHAEEQRLTTEPHEQSVAWFDALNRLLAKYSHDSTEESVKRDGTEAPCEKKSIIANEENNHAELLLNAFGNLASQQLSSQSIASQEFISSTQVNELATQKVIQESINAQSSYEIKATQGLVGREEHRSGDSYVNIPSDAAKRFMSMHCVDEVCDIMNNDGRNDSDIEGLNGGGSDNSESDSLSSDYNDNDESTSENQGFFQQSRLLNDVDDDNDARDREVIEDYEIKRDGYGSRETYNHTSGVSQVDGSDDFEVNTYKKRHQVSTLRKTHSLTSIHSSFVEERTLQYPNECDQVFMRRETESCSLKIPQVDGANDSPAKSTPKKKVHVNKLRSFPAPMNICRPLFEQSLSSPRKQTEMDCGVFDGPAMLSPPRMTTVDRHGIEKTRVAENSAPNKDRNIQKKDTTRRFKGTTGVEFPELGVSPIKKHRSIGDSKHSTENRIVHAVDGSIGYKNKTVYRDSAGKGNKRTSPVRVNWMTEIRKVTFRIRQPKHYSITSSRQSTSAFPKSPTRVPMFSPPMRVKSSRSKSRDTLPRARARNRPRCVHRKKSSERDASGFQSPIPILQLPSEVNVSELPTNNHQYAPHASEEAILTSNQHAPLEPQPPARASVLSPSPIPHTTTQQQQLGTLASFNVQEMSSLTSLEVSSSGKNVPTTTSNTRFKPSFRALPIPTQQPVQSTTTGDSSSQRKISAKALPICRPELILKRVSEEYILPQRTQTICSSTCTQTSTTSTHALENDAYPQVPSTAMSPPILSTMVQQLGSPPKTPSTKLKAKSQGLAISSTMQTPELPPTAQTLGTHDKSQEPRSQYGKGAYEMMCKEGVAEQLYTLPFYSNTRSKKMPSRREIISSIKHSAVSDESNTHNNSISTSVLAKPNSLARHVAEIFSTSPTGRFMKKRELQSDAPRTSKSMNTPVSESSQTDSENRASSVAATPDESSPEAGIEPSPTELHSMQNLTIISIEIHTKCRGELLPDPEFDAVEFVAYVIKDELRESLGLRAYQGFVVVKSDELGPFPIRHTGMSGVHVHYVESEAQLIHSLVWLVGKQWDIDILVGYETQKGAWGYLITRAQIAHNINLCTYLSRTPHCGKNTNKEEQDPYAFKRGTGIHINGRYTISVWQAASRELQLLRSTSFESVVSRALGRQTPKILPCDLSRWYRGSHITRWRTLMYYCDRASMNLEILYKLNVIGQISEEARVYGCQFYDISIRGSQFKVEAMLSRMTRTLGYVMPSPTPEQVKAQAPLQWVPLIMEPRSGLYINPVLVLDFQSLYPSIMIAYNICYSTCLGAIANLEKRDRKLGVFPYDAPVDIVRDHEDKITITPNGVMFLKSGERRGVLPRLMKEILSTRVMVKNAMKRYKGNSKVQFDTLQNRQFALKMIANVTYGYTSASFSGRMPCSDIADSIVAVGKSTLQRSARFVEKTWAGAKVVYGDTDSLFVHLPGASKESAFRIGKEIEKAVTEREPSPMQLKFDKVYLPCVLVTKKRYTGYKYEHVDQLEPEFEAKGIEVIRRDFCVATARIQEKCLRILFDTMDLATVQKYLSNQLEQIKEGRICASEFILSGKYGNKARAQIGAVNTNITRSKDMTLNTAHAVVTSVLKDKQREPRLRERIPYLVVCGEKNATLRSRCKDAYMLLEKWARNPKSTLQLDYEYYITKKIIPPLKRLFDTMGTIHDDTLGIYIDRSYQGATQQGTVTNFFRSSRCTLCNTPKPVMSNAALLICDACLSDRPWCTYQMYQKLCALERESIKSNTTCYRCCGFNVSANGSSSCVSINCPTFFERVQANRQLATVRSSTSRQLDFDFFS
eukprot:CFRG1289T1